ncbi:MAG: glycine zipper 2TM domain-containing protein [Sphingomonadales bacterium]|nr:MAG: glycine zipper 2TM domain-containing protein [Sphingomonadales bacterium]
MIAASIAALAASGAAHSATVCKQDNTGRVVATVVGAGIGAILGNVIDGGSNRTAGTLVGAGVGGVAANQLAKDGKRCNEAYGYYDESGRWHANRIDSSSARGYYDRDNRWVDGAPNGYYDNNNRWVAFNGESQYSGYRDRDGRWVPVGVSGYYAADGQWVGANAPGYYSNGRWVSGPAYGRYDANGRWVADRNYQPSGWQMQSQPGYYDERGRWVRGETTGYYDARGRWVSTGGGRAGNVAYNSRDIRTREARIQQRIDRMRQNGTLSSAEARRARNELSSIKSDESRMRRSGGRFTSNEENVIHQRLDNLGQTLRAERDDNDNWVG